VVTVTATPTRVTATGMTTATAEAVPATPEAMAAPAKAVATTAPQPMTSTPAETTKRMAAPTVAGSIVVSAPEEVETAAGATRRLPIIARVTIAGRLAEAMTEAGCGRAIRLRRSREAAPSAIPGHGTRIRT